jgi:hypothetical protein
MVLSLEQNPFIVMSYYRNSTLQNRERVYYMYKRFPGREFFAKFPNYNIVEANLIPHIRRIVDRFVATVEKGKNVGRASVNEEIVEDFRQ